MPQMFYTYTATGAPLSCGLGIYAPYGGNIRWPQDTGFRSVAISGSLKYITINPVVGIITPSCRRCSALIRRQVAPLSFGLGVYAPYGGNIRWPQDTGFRSVAISGSLKYITINPVVAVKLSPGFSLGGGVMINYADIHMNQGLATSAKPLTNFFKFTGDGWSMGYNLGVLWQPHEKISFGATFRSSARMNFQGNTDFELQPHPYSTEAHRNASSSFDFPLTTVFGVSYRPTPKWNLEFDANYTGWNSFGTTTIKQSPPVSYPFTDNIPVHLDWQASWMYEFGVTRYFDHGWQVSGGYVFNANSVPDKYYTPLAADLNRNFFSLGAGSNT